MDISPIFWIALKLSETPQRDLAKAAGYRPDYVSRIIKHKANLREDDPRIYKLASLLGVPADKVFEQKVHGRSEVKG